MFRVVMIPSVLQTEFPGLQVGLALDGGTYMPARCKMLRCIIQKLLRENISVETREFESQWIRTYNFDVTFKLIASEHDVSRFEERLKLCRRSPTGGCNLIKHHYFLVPHLYAPH
jgi:hypothetical protein